MTEDYRPIPAEEIASALSAERKARIQARALEIFAEELELISSNGAAMSIKELGGSATK